MESKQLTRKLNSIFWWTLSALPIFVLLFAFIYIGKLYGNDIAIQDIINNEGSINSVYYLSGFEEIIDENIFVSFMEVCNLPFIKSAFTNLFSALGLQVNYNYVRFMITGLSWVATIQCYHFILDLLLFVIRWAHDLLERGGKRC